MELVLVPVTGSALLGVGWIRAPETTVGLPWSNNLLEKNYFLNMLVDGKTEIGWDSAYSVYLRSALLGSKVGKHGHSLALLPGFSTTESFLETCDELPAFCLCKGTRAAEGKRLIFYKQDPKVTSVLLWSCAGKWEMLKKYIRNIVVLCRIWIWLRVVIVTLISGGFVWSVLDKMCTPE